MNPGLEPVPVAFKPSVVRAGEGEGSMAETSPAILFTALSSICTLTTKG